MSHNPEDKEVYRTEHNYKVAHKALKHEKNETESQEKKEHMARKMPKSPHEKKMEKYVAKHHKEFRK